LAGKKDEERKGFCTVRGDINQHKTFNELSRIDADGFKRKCLFVKKGLGRFLSSFSAALCSFPDYFPGRYEGFFDQGQEIPIDEMKWARGFERWRLTVFTLRTAKCDAFPRA
jgi:hypothetical protein